MTTLKWLIDSHGYEFQMMINKTRKTYLEVSIVSYDSSKKRMPNSVYHIRVPNNAYFQLDSFADKEYQTVVIRRIKFSNNYRLYLKEYYNAAKAKWLTLNATTDITATYNQSRLVEGIK